MLRPSLVDEAIGYPASNRHNLGIDRKRGPRRINKSLQIAGNPAKRFITCIAFGNSPQAPSLL